jgi:hypothetical protein
MNQKPDFYMSSVDYELLAEPRRCYEIKRISSKSWGDLMLIRIDPPFEETQIRGPEKKIAEIIIAPRHVGETLYPISNWPLFVHVCLPAELRKESQWVIDTELGPFESIVWAELYATEEAARDKKM